MTETELLQLLTRGEDSSQQFKRDATNPDGVAAELAAFANSGGGRLFLGVGDDGSVAGLDAAAVRRLATPQVTPDVTPQVTGEVAGEVGVTPKSPPKSRVCLRS